MMNQALEPKPCFMCPKHEIGRVVYLNMLRIPSLRDTKQSRDTVYPVNRLLRISQ